MLILPTNKNSPPIFLGGHKTKKDPLPFDSESLAEQRWVMPFNEESHIFAFRFGDRKENFGE